VTYVTDGKAGATYALCIGSTSSFENRGWRESRWALHRFTF